MIGVLDLDPLLERHLAVRNLLCEQLPRRPKRRRSGCFRIGEVPSDKVGRFEIATVNMYVED